MKVTIRRCDFCNRFIGEGEPSKLVGNIVDGGWKNDADMCDDCFKRLTSKNTKEGNNER